MNKFLDQARAQLEASTQELDEITLAKLRAARLRALETPSARCRWAPAWAMASVLAAVLWLGIPTATLHVAVLDDLELLTATDSPEFYAEEWEFYAWLAEQNPAPLPADAG